MCYFSPGFSGTIVKISVMISVLSKEVSSMSKNVNNYLSGSGRH